jgi:outer membrane protein assembly complex protein YaeT
LKTIADVKLNGRHHVRAHEIWAALKTHRPSIFPWRERPVLRIDFLASDTRTIEGVYHQHGFLDARADYRIEATKNPSSARVVFDIQEGAQSHVASVELPGVQSIPQDQIRKKLFLRPEKPFSPALLIADTARISGLYKEHGRLPRVVASAIRDSLRVTVRYEVNEGPIYRNGEVYLSSPGESHVRETLVRRELVIKRDETFKASRVQRSVERLYETGLFNQVQITPLVDSTNTRVDFDLRVRERKPRWIDAGVGSGTAERFRFTGEWGHRNLWGRGMNGVLDSRLAFDGRARFLLTRTQASLLEPWLARSRTRGLVQIFYQDSRDRTDPRWNVSQQSDGVTFQLQRDLGRTAKLALTEDNAFVIQRGALIDPSLPLRVRDSLSISYTTHRLQLAATVDTRDDPLNATRGSTQSLSSEVAGGPLQGTSSFTKFQLVSSWYSPLSNGWVLASRVRAGTIHPFGRPPRFTPATGVDLDQQAARVPLEDRFRIGGVNSLRGYDENTIPISGGLAVIQGNAELRVPLVGIVGLELYLDAGNVWARPAFIRWRNFVPRATHRRLEAADLRYVFGTGLRINFPFSPLRIDFTWSARPDENGRWLKAEPQFAIGPSF